MELPHRELLSTGLAAIGLPSAGEAIERLIGYHDLLLERNLQLNLTGHKDPAESIVKNLLNSLAPWNHVRVDQRTADVGTGGGLPGLPLAIMLGMPKLVLVESKAKKCRFLEEAAKTYAPQVRVVCEDGNSFRESMDQVMCSGFGTLDKFASVTRLCRERGARLLAWKGKRDGTEAEIIEARGHKIRWVLHPFTVPGLDAERHLAEGFGP